MKLVAYFRGTLENSARTVLIDHVSARKIENKLESLSYEDLCKVLSAVVWRHCVCLITASVFRQIDGVLARIGVWCCARFSAQYHAILR